MSDSFKWGSWYPIDRLDAFLAGRPSRIFSAWVPSREMSFQVTRLGQGTISRLGLRPDESHLEYWDATHFMPLPPSPEELEAVELVPRDQLKEYRGFEEKYQKLRERTLEVLELMEREGMLE